MHFITIRVVLRLFELMSQAGCSLCADVSANPPINNHSVEQKTQIEFSGRRSHLIHLTVHTNGPVAFGCVLVIMQPLCPARRSGGSSALWIDWKSLFVLAKPLSTSITFDCMSTGQMITNICVRASLTAGRSHWPVATNPHEVSIKMKCSWLAKG